MRAAIAAESAGIPSVSLVCEGFAGQARATARGIGYGGVPLAVLRGHVDAQTADEMAANVVMVIDEIVEGLTQTGQAADGTAVPDPGAYDVVASGTLDEIHDRFLTEGWSDGLPVVPPTRDRVQRFLAMHGHDPFRSLGVAKSSGRDITIWSIAVNAVMAGCSADHLPVLIAAGEILADPNYGAEHSGNTTGADALMILNGPSAADWGFNSGQGLMREGIHANTSVGRWLRLYLRNVFGFTADEHDKATFGNPAKVVLAEHEETLADIGWQNLAADLGNDPGTDVVTMGRINSGTIIGSVFGATPADIVPYLANGLSRTAAWDLTHVYGLGHAQFRPLLVLSPILARTFAQAGWTKDDVRTAMFENARIPAEQFERFIGEWSNLTAGRRTLVELVREGHLPAVYAESGEPDRLVPIATEPSKFLIAVGGDPTRANAYAMSNDGPHGDWTSATVDHAYSSDLECRI